MLTFHPSVGFHDRGTSGPSEDPVRTPAEQVVLRNGHCGGCDGQVSRVGPAVDTAPGDAEQAARSLERCEARADFVREITRARNTMNRDRSVEKIEKEGEESYKIGFDDIWTFLRTLCQTIF